MKKNFILGPQGLGSEGNEGPAFLHVDIQRLIDTRLLIQANSGGGKSWCLRRILEQTHGAVQQLIIDPEGEFSSLRERFDYVLAAKSGGDTAAEPRSARLLAERLLELGVSAILDIYELKAHERIAFVKEFLDALVNAPKKLWHPALVVVDEAHVFCPEKGKAESLGAVIDLATRGRKRGFCAVFATQRLSKLNKDAAAECNNKLIGRTGLDVDVERAASELGFPKSRWPEFRNLGEGDFFAYGPAISRGVVSVHVGGVETTHPKAGARLAFSAPPATEKIRALLPKLADLPAEQEQRAKTEADFKREIAGLKRELAAKPKPAAAPVERVEIPVLREKEIEKLQASLVLGEKIVEPLVKALADVAAAIAKVGKNGHAPATSAPKSSQPRKTFTAPSQKTHRSPQPAADIGDLRPRHVEILRMLVQFEQMGIAPIAVERLAVAVGLKAGAGNTNNLLSALSSKELIEKVGGQVRLTESGRSAAGDVDVPSDREAVMERWRSKLRPRHRELLELVVARYPQSMTTDELGEAVGLQPNSGNFNNLLSRLSSLGLVERSRGEIKAAEALFPVNCALCSRPLTPPSWRSEVLGASYHDACYETAFAMKDVPEQQGKSGGFAIEMNCGAIPVHATRTQEDVEVSLQRCL